MVLISAVAAAPASSSAPGWDGGETTPLTAAERAAMLAAAEQKGAALEQQRLAELTAQGLTSEEATEQLLEEQRQAAVANGLQITELEAQGWSPDEIAAAIPGLVVAGEPPATQPVPLTDPDDLFLGKGQLYYYSSSNSYRATQFWDHNPDLEGGKDAVAIRMSKTIVYLDGLARLCDEGTHPDTCVNREPWEQDPQGVGHRFNSESADYGTISLYFKKSSSGCHQMFGRYAHAWGGNPVISGITISTSGISFSISGATYRWTKSKAGETTGC